MDDRKREPAADMPPLDGVNAPGNIARLGRQLLAEHPEQLNYALLLTATRQLIAIAEVAREDDPAAIVCDVFRLALLDEAEAVAFCSLRPIARVAPRADDYALAQALSHAGRTLGIELFDHVITGVTEYYSFRELGMLC